MKYRNKPVVVEAVQLLGTPESVKEVLDFLNEEAGLVINEINMDEFVNSIFSTGYLLVSSPSGAVKISLYDYVVKDEEGVLFSCNSSDFHKTYEPAEGPVFPQESPEAWAEKILAPSHAVYMRPECVFHYCPHPKVCKDNDQCLCAIKPKN